MYSRSTARRSSKRSSPRPFTCIGPVIPGLTPSRTRCSGRYRATICSSSGRGPTRLISPRTTFQSCGSSSRLVLRRTRPTRVTRGSRTSLKTGSGRRSTSTRSERRSSASQTIVRNLSIRNGLPFAPTRVWWKSTGPLDVFTASASARRSGDSTTSRSTESVRSIARLSMSVERGMSHVP